MNLELRSLDEADVTLFASLIERFKEKYNNEFFFFVVSKEVAEKLGSLCDPYRNRDEESPIKVDYFSSSLLNTDSYCCGLILGINVLVDKKLEGLTIKTYTTILKEV